MFLYMKYDNFVAWIKKCLFRSGLKNMFWFTTILFLSLRVTTSLTIHLDENM